ncbi:hypothetical protein [Companilactobacillus sp. FL22-1]|uniref:hypothetical protein n=1 Tax=Companilactobacillus sp. FL22-1 TaxID=3373892 RepID=UPI003754F123
MKRRIIGFLIGSSIVLLWITLGFFNLILIILAGLVGYLVAALTGKAEEKTDLRMKLIKFLQLKE